MRGLNFYNIVSFPRLFPRFTFDTPVVEHFCTVSPKLGEHNKLKGTSRFPTTTRQTFDALIAAKPATD